MKAKQFVRSFVCRTLTCLLVGLMPNVFQQTVAAAPVAQGIVVYSSQGVVQLTETENSALADQIAKIKAEGEAFQAQLRDPFWMEKQGPRPQIGWCLGLAIIVLIGAAVGIALWGLCYEGGLTTNCPPFWPCHPPSTNTPPSGPVSKMTNSSPMSLSYSGTNAVFRQTSTNDGVAICDITAFGELDPGGQPYKTCARTTLQSGSGNTWTNEITIYIWHSPARYVCMAAYAPDGTLLESVIAPVNPSVPTAIQLVTLERRMAITTTVPQKFFRLSAGPL